MPRLLRCAALVWAACSPAALYADVVYDLAMHNAGFYFQDFNGLPTLSTDTAGYFLNVPFGEQKPVPGALSFDATKMTGSNAQGGVLANDGSLATAGLISLGTGNVDTGVPLSTDRALGALAASQRTMAFGFDLENAYAGGEITSITLDVAPSHHVG